VLCVRRGVAECVAGACVCVTEGLGAAGATVLGLDEGVTDGVTE
jgi:hypothetical protein